MDPSALIATSALTAAVVGAVSFFYTEVVSAPLQRRRAQRTARFDLVRQLGGMRFQDAARFRSMNEVPILFADDDAVMAAWRALVTNEEPDFERSRALEVTLIQSMVHAVGLSPATAKDMDRYIVIVDNGPIREKPAFPPGTQVGSRILAAYGHDETAPPPRG